MNTQDVDFAAIRSAIAGLGLSPRVEPNEEIEVGRAFLPDGHRGVLDLKRQLVVGNRGMGKSFWTHALLSSDLRTRLADVYGHRSLRQSEVILGFNGSQIKSRGFCVVARRTATGSVAAMRDHIEA